jgi:hypothetical protein
MSIEFGFPFRKAEKGRGYEKRVYDELLRASHNVIDLAGTVPTDEYGSVTAPDTRQTPKWKDAEGWINTLKSVERAGNMPAVGTDKVPPCHYDYHLMKRHATTGANKEYMFNTYEQGIYTWDGNRWIMYEATVPIRMNDALRSIADSPKESMALENRNSFRKSSYPVMLTNFVFKSLNDYYDGLGM